MKTFIHDILQAVATAILFVGLYGTYLFCFGPFKNHKLVEVTEPVTMTNYVTITNVFGVVTYPAATNVFVTFEFYTTNQ